MPLIQRLKDFFENYDYSFVLLFGSYSSGEKKELSDIDIGVFFKKNIDYMEIGYQSIILEEKFHKKIDITVLNDIYKKDPLFAFEILNNHKPILINDKNSFISFKTLSQLYYLDYKDLIETNRKSLLYRIENNKIGERNFVREN